MDTPLEIDVVDFVLTYIKIQEEYCKNQSDLIIEITNFLNKNFDINL